MKRVARFTRKDAAKWLAPLRSCLAELKKDEMLAVGEHVITKLHDGEHGRADYLIAGVRRLLERLFVGIGTKSLQTIESKLRNGELLTVAEIDAALSAIHQYEKRLTGLPLETLAAVTRTEMIAVEFDVRGLLAS